MEVLIEDIEKEDDVEVAVHQQDDDADAFAEEYEFSGYIRTVRVTNLTPSVDRAQLGVIRSILVQHELLNEWRRTAIFQTSTKIENKSCKVIMNSGSCINAVASKLITTLWMKR